MPRPKKTAETSDIWGHKPKSCATIGKFETAGKFETVGKFEVAGKVEAAGKFEAAHEDTVGTRR